jgi:hypothetical protein
MQHPFAGNAAGNIPNFLDVSFHQRTIREEMGSKKKPCFLANQNVCERYPDSKERLNLT